MSTHDSPPQGATVKAEHIDIPLYWRGGRRYSINPQTGMEEEDRPSNWQGWIGDSGELHPMTEQKRVELRRQALDAAVAAGESLDSLSGDWKC